MNAASAIVSMVRIVRRRLRRMLRAISLNVLNIFSPEASRTSCCAQRVDHPHARGAPCRQQSAERADERSRDDAGDERAERELKSEDELPDVHQLAMQSGRIRREHAERLAQHRARDSEQQALDHEARQHIEAAEAE